MAKEDHQPILWQMYGYEESEPLINWFRVKILLDQR